MMTNKKTLFVFTLLQVAAVVIALIGTVAAYFLVCLGILGFQSGLESQQPGIIGYALLGFATVIVVSLGSYTALYSFFTMCQRLKKQTAFTQQNQRSMRIIAIACTVCGGMLLVAFLITLLCGQAVLAFVELLFLLSAAYLCIGLVAFALCLLLQRAMLLQQENDLTI